MSLLWQSEKSHFGSTEPIEKIIFPKESKIICGCHIDLKEKDFFVAIEMHFSL